MWGYEDRSLRALRSLWLEKSVKSVCCRRQPVPENYHLCGPCPPCEQGEAAGSEPSVVCFP